MNNTEFHKKYGAYTTKKKAKGKEGNGETS